MYRIFLGVYIISVIVIIGNWCSDVEFRQEQAKVMYTNPKYIRDVLVFTRRKSRNDPYLTNMTVTVLRPIGNNVTFALILALTTGGDFRIEAKACDTVKYKWMRDYMRQFTNLTLDHCPFAAGTYMYLNMELPPKNIPMPLLDGDYVIKFHLHLTATKEPLLQCETVMHYVKTKINSKRNKKKGKVN